MNIQSKMKTRDAKNNPVTAVLVSVLVMFLLSCLFLLLLAALLYKFDLSESAFISSPERSVDFSWERS